MDTNDTTPPTDQTPASDLSEVFLWLQGRPLDELVGLLGEHMLTIKARLVPAEESEVV